MRITRIISRTAREITADIKSGDFKEVWHFLKFLPKQAILGYPKTITIEPINTCNLKCEFCSSPPDLIEREKRIITLKEFEEIIDKIKNYVYFVWLFLAGEPFLNRNLEEMIACAHKNNLHVTTSTNAMLFSQERIKKLLASKLDKLIISFDGTSKKTFESMRVGANFERIIQNINSLLSEKKKLQMQKPEIELQFLVSQINEHEINEFKKLAENWKVSYCLKTIGIPTWIYNNNKCQVLAKKFLPKQGKKRYNQSFNELSLKRLKDCVNAKRTVILADGTVCICCYDIKGQYKMGNIFKQDFLDIWRNEKYVKMRQLMKKRKLKLCQICGETSELI